MTFLCIMLIITEGYECRENILFSKLSSMNPPFFLTRFSPLLPPFCLAMFYIQFSLWCLRAMRVVYACVSFSKRDATTPVSTHVGVAALSAALLPSQVNQGQRSSSEWLWIRDAALNDPHPRAPLQADWLSAWAGQFLDSTLLSFLHHPCT